VELVDIPCGVWGVNQLGLLCEECTELRDVAVGGRADEGVDLLGSRLG
jgi:hypothetical protein